MKLLMGKFEGVLLASDFDGTLCSEQGIAEKNIEAINYFINNGGIFSIVTGRAPMGIKRFAGTFPFNGPFIMCNGAVVYDFKDDKILSIDKIDKSCVKMIKETMTKFPDIGIEVNLNESIYIINENQYTKWHLEREKLQAIRANIDDIPHDIHKILFEADNDRLLELKEYFDSKKYKNLQLIFSSSYFMEMLDIKTSKGTGFLKLCDILKIKKENTFAIGDYHNDIEMLKVASYSACVMGSDDDVKEASSIVLGRANDGAVAQLISIIDKKY